eukprot:226316_1
MFNSILRVIDEKEELSDDDTIKLLEPEFQIPCDKLKLFTNSTIDFEIDSFAIKHQEKYISNPIMIRYQLQNIFLKNIHINDDTIIPYDVITVIQSFLPLAPNMNNVRFVQTHYWLKKVLSGGYSPNDILRNDKHKLEKYYGYNIPNPTYYNNYQIEDDFDDIKQAKVIIDSNKQNHLTYDFGEFSQIYAILLKTNKNGLGKHMIKIKIPKKKKKKK